MTSKWIKGLFAPKENRYLKDALDAYVEYKTTEKGRLEEIESLKSRIAFYEGSQKLAEEDFDKECNKIWGTAYAITISMGRGSPSGIADIAAKAYKDRLIATDPAWNQSVGIITELQGRLVEVQNERRQGCVR